MTQPGQATSAATQESVGVSTSDSELRSLNPADGLFLRAEHLNQIQLYARELARVGGIATGTGVAYGYGLSIDGTDLHVAPGLAIDPSGRPLRSRGALTLDLSALTTAAGRFWVVEVTAAPPVASGSEPVYGELCADPCASGAMIQPWLDDAVRVQVTPDDTLAAKLGGVDSQYRSRLASAYFERERRDGKPWLTPGDGPVGPILRRPWQAAVPADEPVAGVPVPLGAVLLIGGTWVLDVWIARRDLVAAPARTGWESRLSLRSWEIFVAQVLQFQAQLAAVAPAAAAGVATVADVERLYAELLANTQRSPSELEDLFGTWREQHASAAVPDSLVGLGFQELPSAGFLPVPAGTRDITGWLQAMFGAITVTVRHSSADAALRAVVQAQHLDRIPLTSDGGDNPAVKVWIPDVLADLPEVTTPDYGWVAFVRDREPVAVDVVEVYFQPDPGKRLMEFAGDIPAGDRFATLTYPAGAWAVPTEDDVQSGSIEVEYRTRIGQSALGVIGTYADERRRPLALARAAGVVAWLTGLDASATWDVLVGTEVVVAKGDPESIWLVFFPRAK